MVKIIDTAKEYDIEFFSSLPTDLNNPQIYYNSVKESCKEVSKTYPFLKWCFLPTVKPKTAFIQGLLLPDFAIREKHLDREQYDEYGLPIYATIPENFYEQGIYVYDARKRMQWDNIPLKYRHCIPLLPKDDYDRRRRFICTHNKKDITKENCIIGVLNSAYYLFEEYRKFERTRNFELDCLPHNLAKE